MLRDCLLCTVHSTGESALINPKDSCVVVNVTTAVSEYDHCHGILIEAFIDYGSARKCGVCAGALVFAVTFGCVSDRVWCEF